MTTTAPIPLVPAPASVAARVAGCVLGAGYLLGAEGGTLLSLGGALALVTAGRAIAGPFSRDAWTAIVGFVLFGAAFGTAALRWGSTSLDEWREIQAVLGSPVALEPRLAAIGCGVAAGGALLALTVWSTSERQNLRADMVLSLVEIAVVALGGVTAFWGAGVPDGAAASELALALARWIGLTVAVTALCWFLGRLLSARAEALRWWLAGGAASLIAAGLGLTAMEL